MNHDRELEKLERAAYRRYNEDGLWESGLGLSLMGQAVMRLSEHSHLLDPLVVACFCAALLLWTLRDFVRNRRLGKFTPGPYRHRRRGYLVAWIMGCVIGLVSGMIAFGLLGQGGSIAESLFAFLTTMLLFAGIGLLDNHPWLWLYGPPMGFAMVAIEQPTLPARPGLVAFVLFVSGVIAAVTGAVPFIRFLRRYPRVPAPETDGS